MRYPTADELHTILDRTTTTDAPQISEVVRDPHVIMTLRDAVRKVPIAREVQAHAIDLVTATHPESTNATPLTKKFVRYGASPRGAQALILAGKIYALLDERFHVARADIDKTALAALRHRIILNFEGEAEGTTSDDVITEVLRSVAT
jgi:MoxR-like ATPase